MRIRPLDVAQAVAVAVVAARLSRGRRRLPPLAKPLSTVERRDPVSAPGRACGAAREGAWPGGVSVVVPARDEEHRIGPCLRAALADPAVGEVIVVDDGSRDGTARLAAKLGAKVVVGVPPPAGWVGKQWALRQGVAAACGEVVVTLDADTRPAPGLFAALVAALDGRDLVSVGPRFVCDGPLEQALHGAFLATLVYRFGPIGSAVAPPPHRVIANGQCLAFRRSRMLEVDGFARVRDRMTDDVALARYLAGRGWSVAFLDAGGLLEVDMHESAAELWREWGRSLPLHDVTRPDRQAADLAVLWLVAALPVLRLVVGRPSRLDLGLLAARWLLIAALRGSYAVPGLGLWLSPLLDPAAALRLTWATVRPVRSWRGRRYPREAALSLGRLWARRCRECDRDGSLTRPRPGGGCDDVPPARPGRSAAR
ncbi:glycosyltransferase family 2 protein [Thermopolyspora sp. NPDC052614]|uniref:glycosyltransferase n=1 Tax=Thermopolyspora sp. NPDC052614 TaxID=3155682 RepID=UPI00343D9E6C